MKRHFISVLAFFALVNFDVKSQDIIEVISEGVCSCIGEMKEGNPSFDARKDLEHCFETVVMENMEAIQEIYGPDFFDNEYEAGQQLGQEVGKKLAVGCPVFIEVYIKQANDQNQKAAVHFTEGQNFANEGKYEEAVAAYSKAIAINPKAAEYFNYRGVAYFSMREYYRAIGEFYTAIELNPEMYLPYHNMAYSKYELGDARRALSDIEKSISIEHDHALSHNLKGLILNDLERHEEARASFLEASRLDGTDPDYPFNVGFTFYQERNYEKALEWFLKVEDMGKNTVSVISKIGVCYDVLGNFPKSVEYHTRAIELDKEDYGSYFNRGLAYYNLESYEKAIKDFEHAYALNQEDVDIPYNLSRSYLALGKMDQAMKSIQEALEMDPRNASYYDTRAAIYEDAGSYDLAIEDYTVSISLYPSDCEIHLALGKLFAKTQNGERATKYFQDALEKGCEEAGDFLTKR